MRAPTVVVRRILPALVVVAALAVGLSADRRAERSRGWESLLDSLPLGAATPSEIIVQDYARARDGDGAGRPPDDPVADSLRLTSRFGLRPTAATLGLPGGLASVRADASVTTGADSVEVADPYADEPLPTGLVPVDGGWARRQGGYVIRATGTERGVVDTAVHNARARNVGSDHLVRLLAGLLEDRGAFAARLSLDAAPGRLPADIAADPRYTAAPPLQPYLASATGVLRQGEEILLVVVLVHRDHATAAANAAALGVLARDGNDVRNRRRWSTLLDPPSVEVLGTTIVATFGHLRAPDLWLDLGRHPDSLLWWRG